MTFREKTLMLVRRVTSRRQAGEGSSAGGSGGDREGGGGGPVARALMGGLRVLLILTLLVLADSQRWPSDGDCLPCQCYYKITSFGRLRHVNCSQRGLRAVPEGLPSDLMALDLSWNPLDPAELRQRLCQFQSLQSLSLTFADLTTLSDIFGECSSVLELNLTGNRLAQLDTSTFQGLKNLRRLLGLEAEAIVTREVFQGLTNLRDLDLVFHGDRVPKGLFDNMGLKSVNLVFTQAKVLPKGIFRFGAKTLNTVQLVGEQMEELNEDLLEDLNVLRKLFLIMPQVKTLPVSFFRSQQRPQDTVRPVSLQEVEITGVRSIPENLFGQLDNIESLRLKDISSFPSASFLAGLVNLRTLVITGSQVKSIPEGWFKELYSLKTLQLSNLELENLDDDAFVGLLNVNYLDLSYNSLSGINGKTLQPLSQTLESLILTGNQLSQLSEECLKGLFSLRYLDVSENRLSAVYGNSFRGMTRLSVLYLTANRLTSLPTELFKDQLQLESLSLSDNNFVEFPKAVLQLRHSLVSLDLSFNEIRGLPSAVLCEFTYLERINIIGNPLHCDCNLLGFQSCPHIAADGVCQTPETEFGKSLQIADVPNSCTLPSSSTNSSKILGKGQSGILDKTPSLSQRENVVGGTVNNIKETKPANRTFDEQRISQTITKTQIEMNIKNSTIESTAEEKGITADTLLSEAGDFSQPGVGTSPEKDVLGQNALNAENTLGSSTGGINNDDKRVQNGNISDNQNTVVKKLFPDNPGSPPEASNVDSTTQLGISTSSNRDAPEENTRENKREYVQPTDSKSLIQRVEETGSGNDTSVEQEKVIEETEGVKSAPREEAAPNDETFNQIINRTSGDTGSVYEDAGKSATKLGETKAGESELITNSRTFGEEVKQGEGDGVMKQTSDEIGYLEDTGNKVDEEYSASQSKRVLGYTGEQSGNTQSVATLQNEYAQPGTETQTTSREETLNVGHQPKPAGPTPTAPTSEKTAVDQSTSITNRLVSGVSRLDNTSLNSETDTENTGSEKTVIREESEQRQPMNESGISTPDTYMDTRPGSGQTQERDWNPDSISTNNEPVRTSTSVLPKKIQDQSTAKSSAQGGFQKDENVSQKSSTKVTGPGKENDVSTGGSNQAASREDEQSRKQSGKLIESMGEARAGQRMANRDNNAESSDESMAFNFTIGAVAAVLVFGGLVVTVYGVRRCQRQGTYIVAGRSEAPTDQELHSMESSQGHETPPAEYVTYSDQPNIKTHSNLK